jgi:N-formylglutamate deformylase
MEPVAVLQGDGPVVLGFPHVGTHVPEEIAAGLNDEGRRLRDTDWHVFELYDGLLPGASSVRANFHRYVIDANRDPSGTSLYPGQTTTGLIPVSTFDHAPIWQPGCTPDDAETARRLALYHAPYHAALRAELERVRARHGAAVLFDCHSIRSVIPWMFEGTLPDFNIGTNLGQSCAPAIEQDVFRICAASGRSHVLNGRFRGGWTTRHYGQPARGIHAIQLELTQSSYLAQEEPPFALSAPRLAALRPVLGAMLTAIATRALELAV